MSRIARNSVNGRLNRNTCSGAEVAPVQCKWGLILPFCLIEKITFTLQESLSYLYPLLLDGMVTISLQLHRSQRAEFQSMFCNLPKENHPKSSYDMILELKDALSFPLNQIQLALHQ